MHLHLQLAALGVFVAIFAVSALRNVHLGILMFSAACGVGILWARIPLRDVLAGFPVNVMVLLAGVTYFFAIAQANGTIDRTIKVVLARVGNSTAVLPLAFFCLTASISAMGSPLAGLVMAPIGLPLARKNGMDPMLMALAIGTGLSAGAFAPTSLFGMVSYGTAHQANIALNPVTLFAVAVATNLILLIAAYLIFGGPALLRSRNRLERGVITGGSAAPALPMAPPADPVPGGSWSPNQIATIACIVGFAVTIVACSLAGLDPDIGVWSFAFAALLTLIDPVSGKIAVAKIDWSTVLLVGGIMTYIGVLQTMGAIDLLGDAAETVNIPIVAALALCIVGALVSAFASTTGILAALVPLALPLVSAGHIAGWALISALAVCASIVDVSPFSTVGATLIASAAEEERSRMTSLLARWGLGMVVVGPIVLIGALVLPTSL